jgi:hypothetical protein
MLGEPVRADGAMVPALRVPSHQSEHDTDRDYRARPDRDPNHHDLAVMPNAPVLTISPARSLTAIQLQQRPGLARGPRRRHALARVGDCRRDDVYCPGHA